MKKFGILSAVLGLAVLVYVFYPIIGYEITSRLKFGEYLSPIPAIEEHAYAKAAERGQIDFTRPDNWFPSLPENTNSEVLGVQYYNISIPALSIKNSTVEVGGEDLSESLIQYPGTALPGKRGNGVIFGHSVLPQFFNPKDYLTVFSTLPTIEKGDEIDVSHDGISYKYVVEDMFEVGPTDIEILAQNTSDSFLTLVTCVPPGHPARPRRLIVRARLVPYF